MTQTIIIYAHATPEEARSAAFQAGYHKKSLDWDEEWNAYRPILEREYRTGREAAQNACKMPAVPT